MHKSRKLAVNTIIIVAFASVALFGFAAMIHGPDGKMEGGCLFSAMGASLCPQDTTTVAIHHLASYSAFLNVPTRTGAGVLLLSLFLFVLAVVFFGESPPLLIPLALARIRTEPPSTPSQRKITRWLSLLENSPSFL